MSFPRYTFYFVLLTELLGDTATVNQFTTSHSGNVHTWQSASDFIPVLSESFGEIPIGDEMSVEFDFVYHGRANSDDDAYANFFRIGSDADEGNHCDGVFEEYPALWIQPSTRILHIDVDEGHSNNAVDLTECLVSVSFDDHAIEPLQGYHIRIAFNHSILEIELTDGDAAWSRTESRSGTNPNDIGKSVPIWWMSNKFGQSTYPVGNATFSNIVIQSVIYTDQPTSSPTVEPTNPSSAPSKSPSKQPTDTPTTEPTESATERTSSPTISPTTGAGGTITPTNEPSSSSLLVTDITDVTVDANENPKSEEMPFSLSIVILGTGLILLCCCCALMIAFFVYNRKMAALDDEDRSMRPVIDLRQSADRGRAQSIAIDSSEERPIVGDQNRISQSEVEWYGAGAQEAVTLRAGNHSEWTIADIVQWMSNLWPDGRFEMYRKAVTERLIQDHVGGEDMTSWDHDQLQAMGIRDFEMRQHVLAQIEVLGFHRLQLDSQRSHEFHLDCQQADPVLDSPQVLSDEDDDMYEPGPNNETPGFDVYS